MHFIINIKSLTVHKEKDKRLEKTSLANIYMVNIN